MTKARPLGPGWYGLRFCDCHTKGTNKGKSPFQAHTLDDVRAFRWDDTRGHLIADLRCGAVIAWGVQVPA